jgi:hypothetical protein
MSFASEVSLGWYRSAASTLALSYGTFLNQRSVTSWIKTGVAFGTAAETMGIILGTDGSGTGGVPIEMLGSTSASGYAWRQIVKDLGSENFDLVFSRRKNSGTWTSVMTLRGTDGAVWISGSGLSLGNTTAAGSPIRAISSHSSLVAGFVVQASASSFTIVTWTAAQPGDQILTTIMPDAAVSSLSSGLVLHSHCTKAGQIELRLSNVSTLAQNQSSKTYFFTRVTPF